MAKKARLGRGLEALLGAAATDSSEASSATDDSLKTLPIDRLKRGRYQPRVDMRADTLDELAASIRAQGLVQPIVVRPDGASYEIIAGERRWRAAQIAELKEVPVVIRDVPDKAVVAMALIENIQRENLNPLEEATALDRLIAEFDMTHQEAAEAVGRSRAAVSNLLRLLELEPGVKRLVEQRDLEMGHARALLALPATKQLALANKVVGAGLSVRATEQLVKAAQEVPTATAKSDPDPDIQRLERRLSDDLGAKIMIKHGKAGKGQMVIQYNSLDELDGIIERVAPGASR